MRLFSKLFGSRGPSPEEIALQAQFDTEWVRAVKRFGIVTGAKSFDLELKHPQTMQIISPHEGLGKTYNDWKQHLDWAVGRRRVLFGLLAEMVGGMMKPWQMANYLVADSRPAEALEIIEETEPSRSEDDDYAEQCAAFARAYLSMAREKEALEWARKAVGDAPDTPRFRTLVADALHLMGQCEEAHALYSQLMQLAPHSETGGERGIEEVYRDLFSQETGVVPSPVFAVDLAGMMADPGQVEVFWDLGELEFYYSPYFRMHHAYYLAKIGASERSFAKLYGVVDEMPWMKEANLNLELMFRQFDPAGNKINPEFQEQLRRRIQENGWSVEGMHQIVISQAGQ